MAATSEGSGRTEHDGHPTASSQAVPPDRRPRDPPPSADDQSGQPGQNGIAGQKRRPYGRAVDLAEAMTVGGPTP